MSETGDTSTHRAQVYFIILDDHIVFFHRLIFSAPGHVFETVITEYE
jgi:hypothetical protein